MKENEVKKEEKEEEKGKGKPVEKKRKVKEKIEHVDVKPKVEEVEVKVKMSTGQFEVKTIGLKKRGAKKYWCHICKDIVDSIGDRNRHMAEKHNLNDFKYGKYDEKFEMENLLKRHKKNPQ